VYYSHKFFSPWETLVGTGYAGFGWKLVVAITVISGLWWPAAAADRVALVIGNGKYVNANPLPNPPNDARAIANKLSDIGFDVAFGQDLDRAGMERLVRDFLHKVGPAKVALLYYAGHGLQVDGRNYLVPIDAKLEAPSDLNYETIKLDDILDNLNEPSRANIIILDACRDNPLARSFAARLGASRSTAVATGLAGYSTLGTGTLIAFSTAPGQVALDGDGVNSPFTQALVKHLATPGLEVRQMLTRVRDDVARATRDRQVPWDNSSLRGDVYLADVGKAVVGGSVPANAVTGGADVGSGADTVRAATPSPPGPSANTPSADEVAWDFVKNTRDPGELRRFIEQFPKSAHVVEAATKLAALVPICEKGYHAEGERCVADKMTIPERIRERIQEHELRAQQRERGRETPEGQRNPAAGGPTGCAPSVMPCQ
jgi:hypothetical protein